jgi:folate-binding protein YgfZ
MVLLAGYRAARSAAAVVDRSDRGRLLVTGGDRVSFLQGLLTNDLTSLRPGRGCYAAFLTPQGRMISDVWAYDLADSIMLTVGRDITEALLAKLDQSIFSDDVRLVDATDTWAGLAVVGPESAAVAAALVSGAVADQVSALPEHGSLRAEFRGHPAILVRITDTGEPGIEILTDRSHLTEVRTALADLGVIHIDEATAEALRVEGGIPKFHRDMNEQTIPLEAGIEARAISLTKGCYVGQEVIVRVLHRGHGRIARRLVGLTLDGSSAPEPGAAVSFEDRQVGQVTTSVLSPALNRAIALAYVQRDSSDAGTRLAVSGQAAVVTPLPFVQRTSATGRCELPA